jgi:hypothetical protein
MPLLSELIFQSSILAFFHSSAASLNALGKRNLSFVIRTSFRRVWRRVRYGLEPVQAGAKARDAID